MLNSFACGTASFKHQEDDPWNLSKLRRSKSKKNPYSGRGVDTFLGLLAELEERKERIYAEISSPEESLVRFGYSNRNGWIPIVVRLNEREEALKAEYYKEKDDKSAMKIQNSEVLIKSPKGLQVEVEGKKKRAMWRYQPQFCLVMVIVLILMCLVISGKSLAVFCTSIGWYLLPWMQESKMNLRNSMNKKDYGRWFSGKKMTNVAPVVVKSLRRGQSNKGW